MSLTSASMVMLEPFGNWTNTGQRDQRAVERDCERAAAMAPDWNSARLAWFMLKVR